MSRVCSTQPILCYIIRHDMPEGVQEGKKLFKNRNECLSPKKSDTNQTESILFSSYRLLSSSSSCDKLQLWEEGVSINDTVIFFVKLHPPTLRSWV